MPTRTQQLAKENEIRDGIAATFVEGTETTYPGRAEKRRLARGAKHKAALEMRRLLNG